jgi:hypothetical protein
MVALFSLAVAIPVVLLLLVLLRDRYMPWMKRHQAAIWFAGGVGEVAVAVVYLIRGVSGWEGWFRFGWSLVLAAYFFWQAASSWREAQSA